MKKKTAVNTTTRPILDTVLGIIALALIAFFANWLVSISAIGNRTLDLTKDKIHTLTPGTKSILRELQDSEAEVVINYYATRDAEFMPRNLELYMKKVDGFLKRYQAIAGDNLRIVNLDPKPDTDAEDSANLDGIVGQSLNDENLYLGLSISFLDEKAAIPFLDPAAETQLEYQLSSAIARVARTDKQTLGLMSAYPMAGGSPGGPQSGQAPNPPFIVFEQLQQSYELKDIGMSPTAADLEGLSAILLIHPADITNETEYLLDQYLLSGGTLVAALDAYSVTAEQVAAGNPALAPGRAATTSTFSEKLLEAWGISFISDQVLADGNYRTRFPQGDSTSAMTLTKEALPQEDSIITNNLNNLFFVLSGAFTSTGKEGLSHTSLIRSSTQSGFVDGRRAARADPGLLGSIPIDDKAYDLAVHIQGNFQTAFPDGDPSQSKNKENDSTTDNGDGAEGEQLESATQGLTKSAKPGNVFLISDSDFINDSFAYQQVYGGLLAPRMDNAALLFNILDQVTGSRHLIGSRSRNDSRRPFTVIQEMESNFEQEFGEKREQEQEELNKVSERLNELILAQQENGQVTLEGEVKEEYDKALTQQVEARKRLRELEKNLRREKDRLATRYTLANIFIVPGIVILLGITVSLKRRLTTSAR